MPKPLTSLGAIAAALVLGTSAADAGLSPEKQCQKGRYTAAAAYAQCENKALAQLFATNDPTKLQPVLSKCRVKYTGTWVKLQKKALGTGSSCDTNRFTDNGDGTVTDHLTGLDWEMKSVNANVHNKDSKYNWPAAYETFLSAASGVHGLNQSQPPDFFFCFALAPCDWRLPTVVELQTILSEPFPCTTSPCIDPIFGPTAVSDYWAATTLADDSTYAWGVFTGTGEVSYGPKSIMNAVRAVRGGL